MVADWSLQRAFRFHQLRAGVMRVIKGNIGASGTLFRRCGCFAAALAITTKC
jgi:hypothetical protein